MQLSKDVNAFTSACERLLAAGAIYRPLTPDEARLIEFYCKELLQKILPSSSSE
jgi:hypothetical protein